MIDHEVIEKLNDARDAALDWLATATIDGPFANDCKAMAHLLGVFVDRMVEEMD